jgi:predicted permease
MWGWNWLGHLLQDIGYGIRMLRKSPGFTLIAVLTLALGIGANTAIFSMVNAVMLRSLQVREPGQLVLFSDNPKEGMSVGSGLSEEGRWQEFSLPLYQDLVRRNRLLEGICAVQSGDNTLAIRFAGNRYGTGTEIATGKLVSGNYFSVLGVDAVAGRTLTPADDQPNAPAGAVISFNYWKSKLSGDTAVVGSAVDIDGIPVTVVGVAGRGFYGVRLKQDPEDFWLPLSLRPRFSPTALPFAPRDFNDPHTAWLDLVGRLKPGVSLAQANADIDGELRQYLAGLLGSAADENDRQKLQRQYVSLAPGARGLSEMRHEYAAPLNILLTIVGFVLLIACANVANLLLSRTRVRQREMALRLALGATRGRLVRQLLAESLLLAILGGAAGVLLASWGVSVLVSLVPPKVPLNIKPDLAVCGFTVGVSLLTVLLSGLTPALKSVGAEVATALKAGSRAIGARPSRLGLGKSLVVFQIAVSLLLLIGAGLLIRSLIDLENEKLGFSPEHVLLVNVDPNLARYQPKQLPNLYRELLDRISAVPGVRSASIGSESPMSGGESYTDVSVQGESKHKNEAVRLVMAGPRYFETEGMRIVAGRDISVQDIAASTPIAIVNRAFAQRFLPNLNPVGRRFSMGSPFKAPGMEIVGVVEDARYSSPAEKPEPAFFRPVEQMEAFLTGFPAEIEIRAAGNPVDLAAEVRRAIQLVDSNLPIEEVTPLSSQVRDSFGQQRTISQVTGFFGFLGLVLACVGLYGIMAYNVALRTNEMGIRMALGANRSEVLRLVVGRGMLLTVIGMAAGIVCALALTRFLSSVLYGVRPTDPLTFASVSMLLASVAALASYVPARRASKLDPMVALRYE